MNESVSSITDWLIAEGLRGARRTELLEGYCERLVAAGVPLLRAHVSQRTLHPVYGAVGFLWRRHGGPALEEEYERSAELAEKWRESPFRHMIENREYGLRVRLEGGNEPLAFPVLEELRSEGATDYLACAVPFGEGGEDGGEPVAPLEGVVSSWTTDAAGGFSDAQVNTIGALLPTLALALKSAGMYRVARDLLAVYLGRDAGRRVLSGEIQRGTVETIRAVIWYCDLQGFTKLAERMPAERLIAMLNEYFAVLVEAIEGHGGNVLKFMGDGLLAIFNFGDDDQACCAALEAADEVLDRMAALNAARAAAGQPLNELSLALHMGEVMYGNIGGRDRLDFTVVGPAVNEAARIEAMCRPLERNLVISAAFAGTVESQRERIVSLGRYALRGVQKPQELFTLVPPEDAAA